MTDQPRDTTAVDKAAQVDESTVDGTIPGRNGGPEDKDAMEAAEGLSSPQSVSDEYGDMLERGAKHRGEGRVP